MTQLEVTLQAVIMAVTDEEPRIVTVPIDNMTGLPSGSLDPAGDRTLELALRRWVLTLTGLELGYAEQLYTFADRFRDPREAAGGARLVSVTYLALVRETVMTRVPEARWQSIYDFLPWEDRRYGAPPVLEAAIHPALYRWIDGAPGPEEKEQRRERADIAFGLHGGPWDGYRVLERYELLYAIQAVAEASGGGEDSCGQAMALDHRRMVATALGRMRGKIRYRPVVFELLPETFTLLHLQRAVEALAGVRLHKQNFRRLMEEGGLVEGTGRTTRTSGRPAELFRFRREVLRERPAPGVLPSRV